MNVRTAAARVMEQVLQGRSLSDCLPEAQAQFRDARDSAFLQALCYGVCRSYDRLDKIVSLLLDRPLKDKDSDIYALLLVGIYQLTDMRIPPHAAVSETVAAVSDLKKDWAKNLVNAVLRNYQRRTDEINDEIKNDLTACYSHPAWMLGKLKKQWPDEWQAMLEANNQHPPFSLRVNQRQTTRDAYLPLLAAAHIIPETRSGIILEQAMDVEKLPGFSEGMISVQDGAAQLAAELLDVKAGQTVLDACAAPGGKTAHLLEIQPDIQLTAVDSDAKRLQIVRDNLKRLQLHATCVHADVGDVKTWWDGQLFDRILLDAPCSALGVIRRHPDIKLLRQASDIEPLAREQQRLLASVWNLLKPGGLLLYATCSMLKEENVDVIGRFLEAHPDAKEEPIQSDWGKSCRFGKQILPGMHEMDGFYYARLRK